MNGYEYAKITDGIAGLDIYYVHDLLLSSKDVDSQFVKEYERYIDDLESGRFGASRKEQRDAGHNDIK